MIPSSAYVFELVHLCLAGLGLVVATFNMRAEWRYAMYSRRTRSEVSVVLLLCEYLVSAAFMLVFQLVSFGVAAALIYVPPPPLPDSSPMVADLTRSAVVCYIGVFSLTTLALFKTISRMMIREFALAPSEQPG